MNSKLRKEILERDNYTCQYCGEYPAAQPQIDHIEPIHRKGLNDTNNLRTACRMCNFYKNVYGVEDFRRNLTTLIPTLRKSFIFRLAEKYGLVKVTDKSITFKFEESETE